MASIWQAFIWWEGSTKRFHVILRPSPICYRVCSCPQKVLPETRVFRLDSLREHEASQVNQSINDQISFYQFVLCLLKLRWLERKQIEIVQVPLQWEKITVVKHATWHIARHKKPEETLPRFHFVFRNDSWFTWSISIPKPMLSKNLTCHSWSCDKQSCIS